MMNGKSMGSFDPKKQAIEELMKYLDHRDGQDLGESMKPKGMGVEVTKVQKLGEDGSPMTEDAEEITESPEEKVLEAKASPEMSDEEMDELIEALQSKLSG